MKTIITFFKSFGRPVEIQEAPRFEEWWNQMNPKDKPLDNFDEFRKVILEHRFGKRAKKLVN
jgi:hypothetical protein